MNFNFVIVIVMSMFLLACAAVAPTPKFDLNNIQVQIECDERGVLAVLIGSIGPGIFKFHIDPNSCGEPT